MRDSEITPISPPKVAGVAVRGKMNAKTLVIGDRIMLVELNFPKGFFAPTHKHPEHESTGYVIKGKLRMNIAGKEYVLLPGTAWHHPKGVEHSTEALEDSIAVEIHTPLRQDFVY